MNQKALVPEENVPSLEQLKIPARVATKNALNLDKGIVGKYDGEFPLTSATVGGVYFVPQTKKYYECLKAFDGTTSGQTLSLPNADFKELSILENKNKLDNLGKLKYFKITDKSPYFILEMYKIDKNVFSFIKITGNIKLDNIIIPEEIRPSVNKSVALHDTNSVNTVTLRFQTDGKVLIVNGEPINLPLCMNMIVWDTN